MPTREQLLQRQLRREWFKLPTEATPQQKEEAIHRANKIVDERLEKQKKRYE